MTHLKTILHDHDDINSSSVTALTVVDIGTVWGNILNTPRYEQQSCDILTTVCFWGKDQTIDQHMNKSSPVTGSFRGTDMSLRNKTRFVLGKAWTCFTKATISWTKAGVLYKIFLLSFIWEISWFWWQVHLLISHLSNLQIWSLVREPIFWKNVISSHACEFIPFHSSSHLYCPTRLENSFHSKPAQKQNHETQ